MANWSLPGLTDLYTNFRTYLMGRDEDATRLNDTRATAPSNLPAYAKRWNDSTQTFQNWWSSVWSNLVLAVAGGGTGASTAAGARTNLDVYSKAESDEAYVTALSTAEDVLVSSVALTDSGYVYNGPSVSLATGTWLVIGTVQFSATMGYLETLSVSIHAGAGMLVTSSTQVQTESVPKPCITVHDILVLGTTTTIYLAAMHNGASTVNMTGYGTYIRAVKVA